MELQSILSFLVITEKFGFEDLILPSTSRLNTIDRLSPVYKDINDKYIIKGSDVILNDSDIVIKTIPFYTDNEEGGYSIPRFRTYFDFTSVNRNEQEEEDEKRAPVEVQIRVQFVEPNQDTLGVNKHRRFLRTGQLQFLVIAKFDKESQKTIENEPSSGAVISIRRDKRPLFEAFKIAQYYADKYEGTDGIKILRDIDKKEGGTEDSPGVTIGTLNGSITDYTNQFTDLQNNSSFNTILNHLFPGIAKEPNHYNRIVQEVKTLNTGVARIVNLRFAELERRTVDPIRITNPTYGLAVTIPFTFEQTR